MTRRICLTQPWKRAQAQRQGVVPPETTGPVSEPLFHGQLYVANVTFQGVGGPWSVNSRDLSVILEYLKRAIPPIVAYCSQYGKTQVTLAPNTIPFNARVSRGEYSDMDLQVWVNQIAQLAGLSPSAGLVILNPQGVVNTDAKESGGVGVLGYHGLASVPYSFVNLLGGGFTLDDPHELYAEALSHEVAEMTVDPRADSHNPEVCDGCGTNCQGEAAYRSFFDAENRYAGSSTHLPPGFPYQFFISAIAKPSAASECPAPSAACAYAPPGTA